MPSLLRLGLDKLLFRPLIEGTKQLGELSKSITDWRVAQGDTLEGQDLFSHLLRARDPETGKCFSHDELVAEASLFIVGGTDTTITAISATLFYLLKNPAALRRVQSEVRETFSNAREICMGPRLEGCTYLTACIEESLRICPPTGSLLPREVLPGGIKIDDEVFPAGTDIGVPHYALHHNEEYYPNPFQYHPERWIGGDVETVRSAFAAFGVGRTACIGKHLAYQEMRLVLGRMLWSFDMQFVGESVDGGTKDRRRDGVGKLVEEEFRTLDRFVSMHEGPMVRFRARKS